MENIVSIITVAYNAGNSIEKTILSVIEQKQKYKNIEYIIIDGKSTDSTINIIQKYDKWIDYWISESDKGIYDAMNKGITKANGEYIIFLGADDLLLDIPIDILNKGAESDINAIIGNVLLSNGKIFHSYFSWKLIYMNTIHHQSLFLQTKILKQYYFNIKYKIYADHDLNQKLYKEKISFIKIDNIICKFNIYGASKQNNIKEIATITYYNFGIKGIVFYLFILSKRFLLKYTGIKILKNFIKGEL